MWQDAEELKDDRHTSNMLLPLDKGKAVDRYTFRYASSSYCRFVSNLMRTCLGENALSEN